MICKHPGKTQSSRKAFC